MIQCGVALLRIVNEGIESAWTDVFAEECRRLKPTRGLNKIAYPALKRWALQYRPCRAL